MVNTPVQYTVALLLSFQSLAEFLHNNSSDLFVKFFCEFFDTPGVSGRPVGVGHILVKSVRFLILFGLKSRKPALSHILGNYFFCLGRLGEKKFEYF